MPHRQPRTVPSPHRPQPLRITQPRRQRLGGPRGHIVVGTTHRLVNERPIRFRQHTPPRPRPPQPASPPHGRRQPAPGHPPSDSDVRPTP
ncbi:hypothetical protein DVS28_b0548 (plasmid) [Euzebya pacifica]|uniref:Uncharacterized protein n=1 Tax=Euzebya pacifica TaxID=1608957 RepID=A0A346Y741_9ACTN|nr:hypothetical protein DVS28_b0548 [Euzebya pacifica]